MIKRLKLVRRVIVLSDPSQSYEVGPVMIVVKVDESYAWCKSLQCFEDEKVLGTRYRKSVIRELPCLNVAVSNRPIMEMWRLLKKSEYNTMVLSKTDSTKQLYQRFKEIKGNSDYVYTKVHFYQGPIVLYIKLEDIIDKKDIVDSDDGYVIKFSRAWTNRKGE